MLLLALAMCIELFPLAYCKDIRLGEKRIDAYQRTSWWRCPFFLDLSGYLEAGSFWVNRSSFKPSLDPPPDDVLE